MEKERYNELKDKRIIVAKAKDNSYLNALELRNASLNVVYKYLRDNKENIEIENHLYLVVAIKKSGVIETKSTKVASASIPDNSIISIHDLIQKINPDAIDFLKYIPNQFLTIEQLVGKKQGILKDITKYPNSPFKNVSTT